MNPDAGLVQVIDDFITEEKLPAAYQQTVQDWFLPLLDELKTEALAHGPGYLLGISGSQGSGKSTLAQLLVKLFRVSAGLSAINLSMDDFYFGHDYRQQLASKVHPLLATRGVPGTHEISLLQSTVARLGHSGKVKIPRFDKSVDDRCPVQEWPEIEAPVDIVIVEGWCLGIPAQDPAALIDPVNSLEREEDAKGIWRGYVNDCLREQYQPFYDALDKLVVLRAPAFEKVFEWRQNQEDKLAARTGGQEHSRIMNPAQLKRFIQHYERLTRNGLQVLPDIADTVFQLDNSQDIASRNSS